MICHFLSQFQKHQILTAKLPLREAGCDWRFESGFPGPATFRIGNQRCLKIRLQTDQGCHIYFMKYKSLSVNYVLNLIVDVMLTIIVAVIVDRSAKWHPWFWAVTQNARHPGTSASLERKIVARVQINLNKFRLDSETSYFVSSNTVRFYFNNT